MCAEVYAPIVDETLPLIAALSLPLALSVLSRAVFRFETSVELLQESVPVVGLHLVPSHRFLTGHAALSAPTFLASVLADEDTRTLLALHWPLEIVLFSESVDERGFSHSIVPLHPPGFSDLL